MAKKYRLNSIQSIHPLQERIGRNRERVSCYWKNDELDGIWRKWRNPRDWDRELSQEQIKVYLKEMNSRKVKARTGKDILRWGNNAKGSFTVKEAYCLTDTQAINEENQEWIVIWKNHWWPKISLFTWLTAKNKILTWDRIQKKGFCGSSRCYLCKREEETRDHLFINCLYTRKLWLDTKKTFSKSEQTPGDIKTIIFQWHKEKFQCKVVCRAWNLIASFVLWMAWKERNRRIFQDKTKNVKKVWERAINLMRETILSEKWDKKDWKTNPVEEKILFNLNLSFEMVYQKQEKETEVKDPSPDKFRYPEEIFIKLNLDGASKGNPGNSGFGGIFRDHQKRIRWIYAEWGGDMTNNEAELWAIHQGLRIAIRNGYSNL